MSQKESGERVTMRDLFFAIIIIAVFCTVITNRWGQKKYAEGLHVGKNDAAGNLIISKEGDFLTIEKVGRDSFGKYYKLELGSDSVQPGDVVQVERGYMKKIVQ